VLSAVAAISCSDATLGSGRVAHVVLQPQFSTHDAAIYSSLETFNLGITSLRIVLVRPSSTDTLADTTITVSEGQDSIVVAVPVTISGSQERLDAVLEMYSGTLLVFTGSTQVIAKAGVDVVSTTPVVVTTWVGPGTNATKIRISPRDTAMRANAQLAFEAAAFDVNNAPVTDPQFLAFWRWDVLEPNLGSIPVGGGAFVGKGVRGVARVRVFTPNLLEDTVRVSLVPPPTQLVTISGGGQSASEGQTLGSPFIVEVRAADNLPVPDVVVRFRSVSGGGRVAPDTAFTNAQGRAQTAMTVGNASAAQTFEASATGLTPVSITATSIIAQVPASVALGQYSRIVDVGSSVASPAIVKSADGNALDTVTVTYASRSPSVATVAANGSITGVSKGQAIIVATVASNPAIQDSLLAVVSAAGGMVLISSVDRFAYGTSQTVTLSVYIDTHTSPKTVGSTTIDVAWSPAQLTYAGYDPGGSGVGITVNDGSAANGQFTFAMASSGGYSGKLEMVRLKFTTSAAATSGTFALTAREMTSGDLSTNLLATLVQVANPIIVH